MADIFVRLRGDPAEVRLLSVEQGVQEELAGRFSDGANRLLSDEVERIDFTASSYKPDESEVWEIPDFDLPDEIAVAVDRPIECPRLEGVEGMLPEISAIMASLGPEDGTQPCIAFQAFDRRQFLTRRGISVILDRRTFRRLEEPGINIGPDVHAVYAGDSLLFRREYWARRVVDIKGYFRSATEQDVDEFLAHESIAVDDEQRFRDSADQRVRRRLARINNSEILDRVAPNLVSERAAEYGVRAAVDGEGDDRTLVLPSDKQEVKHLLKFLEEEYYEGPLTDRKYIANSKRLLNE